MVRTRGISWLPLVGTVAVFAAALLAQVRGRAPVPEAAPWPMRGGTPQRNFVNLVDRNLPDEWNANAGEEKNILWAAQLGSKAHGSVVVAGGRIFIGTNNEKPRDPAVKGDKGVLMCFEERTGKFLWQIVFDKLPAGRIHDWPGEGIASTPVVEGDRFYFVSNRCELVCAGTADGKVHWRLDMMGKLGVFPHNLAISSPLVVGDAVFLHTSNGVDEGHLKVPAPQAPSFLAVNKNNGEVVWSSNLPGAKILHGQWSSPVYTEAGRPQVIFPGGDGWLYSFDPKKGDLLWKFDCNPKAAIWGLGAKATRNDMIATPVVADGRLYLGVGADPEHGKGVGHLWCIDVTKTPKNADKDLSPFSAPNDPNPKFDPADPANKDSALVWHFGGFTPEGSRRPWHFGRTLSSCAVHDGLCFTADFDGYVYCLDAKTGVKHWDHRMESDTWCSPFVADGKVYLGNENGEVLVFQAAREKKLLATNEMPSTGTPQVRASPVVANGVLYILSENPCKLYAIQKK